MLTPCDTVTDHLLDTSACYSNSPVACNGISGTSEAVTPHFCRHLWHGNPDVFDVIVVLWVNFSDDRHASNFTARITFTA